MTMLTKTDHQSDQTVPEPKGTTPTVRQKMTLYDLEGQAVLDDTADSVNLHNCIAKGDAQDSL